MVEKKNRREKSGEASVMEKGAGYRQRLTRLFKKIFQAVRRTNNSDGFIENYNKMEIKSQELKGGKPVKGRRKAGKKVVREY